MIHFYSCVYPHNYYYLILTGNYLMRYYYTHFTDEETGWESCDLPKVIYIK